MTTHEEQAKIDANIADLVAKPTLNAAEIWLTTNPGQKLPISSFRKIGYTGPVVETIIQLERLENGATQAEVTVDGVTNVLVDTTYQAVLGGAMGLVLASLSIPVSIPLILGVGVLTTLTAINDPGDVIQDTKGILSTLFDNLFGLREKYTADSFDISNFTNRQLPPPEINLAYDGTELSFITDPNAVATKENIQDYSQQLVERGLTDLFSITSGTPLNVIDTNGSVAFKLTFDDNGDGVIESVSGDKRIYVGTTGVDELSFADETVGVDASLASGNTLVSGAVFDIIADNIENLTGGSGDDILEGRGTNNVINGGGGNDNIDGFGSSATGSNTISGGAGNDTIVGSFANNIIDGGADIDTVDFSVLSGTGAVIVNLETGSASIVSYNQSISNVENVIGTSNDDVITGDGQNNILEGGLGADTVTGGAGNDVMVMEHQASTTDVVNDFGFGGESDKLYFSGSGFGGIIPLSYFSYDPANPNANPNVEQMGADTHILFGTYTIILKGYDAEDLADPDNFADSSDFPGGILPDSGTGGGGNYVGNVIDGANIAQNMNKNYTDPDGDKITDGSEIILGNDGNDTVWADATAAGSGDIIIGGKGNDYLNGLGGDDTYIHFEGDGADIISEFHSFANGNDTLIMSGYSKVYLQKWGYDLRVHTNNATDYVVIKNQFFNSQYQVEYLEAATINTNLTAGLYFEDRPGLNSTFWGVENANDTIQGGDGNDWMNGLSGDDSYLHAAGDGADIISEAHSLAGGNDEINVLGFTEEEVFFNRINSDLIIGLGNDGDRIIVKWQLAEVAQYEIETLNVNINIDLTGGLTYREKAGEGIVIGGTNKGDTFLGGDGNDILYGNGGDDIFHYKAGNGNDTIYDSLGNNSLVLDAGAILTTVYNDDLRVTYEDANGLITDTLYIPDYYSSGAWI